MSGDGDAYARGALDRECADLAHASAGRNEQLNKAAFALGQFVGADRLTQSEVESALFHAAVANGYVAKDGPAAARATIRSGIEKGSLEPRLNGAEPRRSEAIPHNRHAAALPCSLRWRSAVMDAAGRKGMAALRSDWRKRAAGPAGRTPRPAPSLPAE